jgi:hypothetical protein
MSDRVNINVYKVVLVTGEETEWTLCADCAKDPLVTDAVDLADKLRAASTCERCQVSTRLVSLELGNFALGAANIDSHADAVAGMAQKRLSGNRVRFTGTREQLLGLLWTIEAAPAFWSGEGAAIEASSLKRTSERWRRLLGVGRDEEIPAPAWATRKAG